MSQARRRLGASGEEQAAAWYRARGYDVLARNWRCRDGEIDLIVTRDRRVVVCEVKTRTTATYGVPAEAVTPAKQRRLRQLAAAWLQDAPFAPREVRFDVAAILAGQIEVIEGAF
ncbi:MAG: putative endonuclease related to Holliday junction resolvase [Acidimicrobiales bacterium]|nr:putative endonuclease related to Holliday junction resolvase [Acidimicrobiales bacterium]